MLTCCRGSSVLNKVCLMSGL
jgi:hypothetical protein